MEHKKKAIKAIQKKKATDVICLIIGTAALIGDKKLESTALQLYKALGEASCS